MEFDRPVVELIRTRTSSRAYEAGSVDQAAMRKLASYIEQANERAPQGVRLAVETVGNPADGAPRKLGTYGVISGASTFIVGIADPTLADPVAFGHQFENVILRATDLGLQTCWLGGTFNRSDFGRSASLRDGEIIPVVSPVGKARARRSAQESVMRTAIGANRRKAWSELFFTDGGTTPLSEEAAGAYAVPLEMVRLGPSASNKQPWRVIADGSSFHFFVSRTKGYGRTGFDLQRNDIGIATCHFELTAAELGLLGRWVSASEVTAPGDWEYVTTWTTVS